MTLKTVPVTGTLYLAGGTNPAANTLVTATLTTPDQDLYDPNAIIPSQITATTDSSGNFTLNLWPNTRGANGSQYRLRSNIPGALPGNWLLNVLITAPDGPSGTPIPYNTITNRTGPSVLSDSKAAMLAAQSFSQQAQNAQSAVGFLYPGTYATPPLKRNDGSPVQPGDRYNSSADGYEYRFVGGAWSSSEKNALASQTAAAGSAASAAHVYPGIYATDPVTRPDGSAIEDGDMAVFTGNILKTYQAGVWAQQTAASSADLADSTNPAKGAALVGVDGDNLRSLYLSAKPMQSYTPLRAYTGSATSVRVTQKGIGGVFWRDDADVATADDGGTVIVDGSGRRWKRLREYGRYMAAWFGAVLDGVTNCTAALALASAAVAATGGTLEIGQGTCIVGAQTFAGSTGKGYAYQPADIIKVVGATMPVSIDCAGTKFKYANGLKYGSFDPTTGAVYNPGSMPFTNADYLAQLGQVFWLQNNASIEIRGAFEIDGNMDNYALGGTWGDTGRQCSAFGIWAYGNKQFAQSGSAYVHHCGSDGIAIGWPNLTLSSDRYPHTLKNFVSVYNGRNNLTWSGGNSLVAVGCSFNHAGRGSIASSPTAGIDIEAENSAYCQGGRFICCEFVNNLAPQMIADSGTSFDVGFDQCTFVGSIWPNKPRYVFNNCKVYGQIINPYGSDSEEDRVRFIGGLISDEVVDGYTPDAGSGLMFPTALASPMLLDGVTIRATRNKLGRLDNAILRRVRMELNAGTESGITDTDWYSIGYGAQIEDLTVVTNIANAPASGYALMITNATEIWRGKNTLTNNGAGKVRWNSWSVGGGGYEGVYGNSNGGVDIPNRRLQVGIGVRGDNVYGAISVYGALNGAVPAGYVVKRGDVFLNDQPAAGGPPAWSVVTAGTTGTDAVLKAWANLAA